MLSIRAFSIRLSFILLCLFATAAHAINKANNADALNLGSSWSGNTAPGVFDIGVWTSLVTTANSVQLGGNLSWQGISIVGPGGAVTIGGANTLTLGFAGIAMNTATQDLTINSGLALLGNTAQTWNIASGRILTLGTGAFSRAGSATLSVQGAGSVVTTNIINSATTGIIGPWATFGTGAATNYAFVNGANTIAAYTGTVVADATLITSTTGLVNYEVSAGGAVGAGASFNTLRYTGTAATVSGNLTTNGILNAGTGLLTVSGAVTIGDTRELVVNSASSAITISGAISNNGSNASALVKTGTGQLNLTGTNNSYTGTTTISGGGVLDVGTISNNALGSGGLIITGNSILQGNGLFTRAFSGTATPGTNQVSGQYGGFAARGGTLTLNFGGAGAPIALNGSGYLFGLNFIFGSPTSDSKVVVVNPIVLNTNGVRGITVNSGLGGDSAEFQGQLLDGGTGLAPSGFTKSGTGLLTLANNTSTYTGATIINAGIVSVATIGNAGMASALGSSTVANPAANLLLGGGTLRYTGVTATSDRNFSITAGSTASVVEVTNAATNLTLSGSIPSTTGALTKSGAGTLTLTGTNLYTGRTTVAAGILDVGNVAAGLAGNSGILLQNNAILQGNGTLIRTFSNTATPGIGQVAGTDGGFAARGGVLTLNFGTVIGLNTSLNIFGNNLIFGSATADSKVVLTSGINLNSSGGARTITVNPGVGGDYAELQGDITENAGINSGLTKSGNGKLVLSGTASYNGVTTVNAGILQFAKEASLYAGATANWTTARIVVNSGATAAFNVGGTGEFTSADIDALAALGTASGGFRSGSRIGFDTTNATAETFVYGSNLANPNAGANTLGLTKIGTGTLVLTGTNTYTGPTTISAGTLQVGQGGVGSTGVTSSLTINGAGAVLAGTGTVNGSSAIIAGKIKPGDNSGDGTGILKTSSLSFTPVAATTVAELQVTGSSNLATLASDRVTITGTLGLNSMSNFVVDGTGYTPRVGDSFTLFSWTSVLTLNGWSTGTNLRDGSSDAGTNLDLPILTDPGFLWNISSLITGSTGGSLVMTVVPEPSRALLIGFAALVCIGRRRRRR